ncbi:MAG: hypothetical protein AB7K24_21120, partial [Gemmataceae bacterium]
MFRWLESWLTPCPSHLRDMGYLRETLNVRACRDQCFFAWEPHLRRTRALILSAVAGCSARRKAILLGAGMLHDVPVEELSARFREVVLVDILPTRAARRAAKRWPNVRLFPADVTGTIEAVHAAARRPGSKLPTVEPDLFFDDDEVDLVASINLLSQLPYLPVQYLKQCGHHADEAVEAYARGVVQAHLEYLARFA